VTHGSPLVINAIDRTDPTNIDPRDLRHEQIIGVAFDARLGRLIEYVLRDGAAG